MAWGLLATVLAAQTPAGLPAPIARLEAEVARNPDHAQARADVLLRYAALTNATGAAMDQVIEARRRHILWFIGHHPESPVLSGFFATLDPQGPPADPQGYAEAARLWKQLAARPDIAPAVHANAAFFFRVTDRREAFALLEAAEQKYPSDPDLARVRGILDAILFAGVARIDHSGLAASFDPALRRSPEALRARVRIETASNPRISGFAGEFLLQNAGSLMREAALGEEDPLALAERWLSRAHLMDPYNATWTSLLITVYQSEASLQLDPREKARSLEKAEGLADTEALEERVLPSLATAEFEAGKDDSAERAAARLLELAAAHPGLARHDNLVHAGHTVLGRVALVRGDRAGAIEQLLASARLSGSPALGSRGPELSLAQELLDAGERTAVSHYLELCRAFWTRDEGRLDHDLKMVRQDSRPDLLAPWAPPGRRGAGRPQVLPAPAPFVANGAILDASKAPVQWTPVAGAASYVVEWDVKDEHGWVSERQGGLVRIVPTTETTVTLDFHPARLGRWRVYAVSPQTGAGTSSEWREVVLP